MNVIGSPGWVSLVPDRLDYRHQADHSEGEPGIFYVGYLIARPLGPMFQRALWLVSGML